jgi:hypothetical protein
VERSHAPHGVLIALLLLARAAAAEDFAPEMVAGMGRYLERLTATASGRDPSAAALRRAYGIEQPEAPASPIGSPGRLGRVLVLSRGSEAEALAGLGYGVTVQPLLDERTRERLYRIGFPLGRHPFGIETETALGLLDALMNAGGTVGIWADAAGAEIALCAAALRPGVDWIHVATAPEPLHKRPLHHDVFGLLRDLGPGGARALIPPAKIRSMPLPAGAPAPARSGAAIERALLDSVPVLERQRIAGFDPVRTREAMEAELIGVLPDAAVPAEPDVRELPPNPRYRGFSVRVRVRPEFGAAGILLLPPRTRGRLPLVFVQHGLQGTPQALFGQRAGRDFDTYRNYAETLVEEGFAVFLPQNPYRGDFRPLSRLAHPLGLTLFSLIRAQYAAALDWVGRHPEIDGDRIGFYGLSYGGKTALRVPTLDPRFRIAVCAGDFNEWVRKLVDPSLKYSYFYSQEYDVLEWNLARIASHAEMAMLMAPRPFLVERGHRDPVGEDEWVSYEFAKVRRYYAEQGLAGKTDIAWFAGPHRIDGVEALRWLKRYLMEPVAARP